MGFHKKHLFKPMFGPKSFKQTKKKIGQQVYQFFSFVVGPIKRNVVFKELLIQKTYIQIFVMTYCHDIWKVPESRRRFYEFQES